MQILILGFLLASCGGLPYEYAGTDAPRFVAPAAAPGGRPKIALVLGSGGRRGFAHVGVIKALEANGIVPDLIVGVSIGALIGALYAGGMSAARIEQLAVEIDLSALIDISFLHWGYVRGQAVQDFVNEKLQQRPIEQLSKPFAAIVTRQSDNALQIFNAGNAGAAVRAASAVPGRFLPVRINGVVYVDGDVASPVPARAARRLGAGVVIAVDISAFVEDVPGDVPDEWVRQDIARRKRIDAELVAADVVIHPDLGYYAGTSAEYRVQSIATAVQATQEMIPKIRAAIESAARASVKPWFITPSRAGALQFPTVASAAR